MAVNMANIRKMLFSNNLFLPIIHACLVDYSMQYVNQIPVPIVDEIGCFNESCGIEFDPYSPLVKCSYLPKDFMKCDDVVDLDGNNTAHDLLGYGCTRFGGLRYDEVQRTRVLCRALEGIECHGPREFLSQHTEPCVQYNGHYFVTTLIYSVLLGFLGVDRFCLGHTGTAVGKLLTLGGVGVWWVVDIILLATGDLRPADNSNWVPHY